MAQSVVENRYSAFKASHDVSESHTMSRLALWWIDVHPPGEAFVVTTTPQVEAILWRYMENAHKKGGLPGRITLDAKWYIGNELVAYGGKPADYDPAAFQGIQIELPVGFGQTRAAKLLPRALKWLASCRSRIGLPPSDVTALWQLFKGVNFDELRNVPTMCRELDLALAIMIKRASAARKVATGEGSRPGASACSLTLRALGGQVRPGQLTSGAAKGR